VFARGTRLLRERDRPSELPIVRNGPPGTFVLFPSGLRVSLPTDQIVSADAGEDGAAVTFGGMRFVGETHEGLTFTRERELWPEAQLSPQRSHTMFLAPEWVQSIHAGIVELWTPALTQEPGDPSPKAEA
jgi:hypothetical protein